MVRTSNRQRLLNDLAEGIHDYCLLAAFVDTSGSDSNGSDVCSNATLSNTSSVDDPLDNLIEVYSQAERQRFLPVRVAVPWRSERMVDILHYWSQVGNFDRFRGLARMTPPAFDELVRLLRTTQAFCDRSDRQIRESLAVAVYRLGRSGNGAGVRDVALNCGCSEGSVVNWTKAVVRGLYELSEQSWVAEKSGTEEWSRGWAIVDGTHIDLAWRPALHPREYYNFRRNYSLSIQLVVLPQSLRIVECVVGFPGSAQDSRVWTAGSKILRQPRLYLDEGEFIWTDGGYGYSPFTLGPYTNRAAELSHDLRTFNYNQSRIRIRAEHAIGFLKQRFQCLLGYHGNLYREEDHEWSSLTIMATIVAHTVASAYDRPDDVGRYLLESGAQPADVDEVVQDLSRFCAVPDRHLMRRRRSAQADFERQSQQDLAFLGESRADRLRKDRALELRESMHRALFESMGWEFVDTDAESRRQERTIEVLVRDNERVARRRRQLRQASTMSRASTIPRT